MAHFEAKPLVQSLYIESFNKLTVGRVSGSYLPGGSAHDVAVGADRWADHRLQGDGVIAGRQRVGCVDLGSALRPAAGAVALVATQRRPPVDN